jgi:hypothetical protein
MKTLKISISERQYQQFGLKGKDFTFSELVRIVRKELLRPTLNVTAKADSSPKTSKRDAITEAEVVRKKIEIGLEQSRKGQTKTTEQAKAKLKKWLK